ncbi:MAG: precorrin-2 C(20)-methyltransferase [Anaerolineae bacterium]|nr:precorrin-2 C(20)-methyltransferase [Anaerolineae bacterium]MDW8071728.1 precorrin-2 C(20)-methyltransferase [Anaerolineae bacterium]
MDEQERSAGSQVATGILYGVGVGPGDPELITLKALHTIQSAHVIAVPVSHMAAESYALGVVAHHLRPEQQVIHLHFPMVRDLYARQASRRAATEVILEHLRLGRDVAFLTEGDPLLHSTFIYILSCLPPGIPLEVIPGVSSVTAAAAQAVTPLVSADQRLAILPAVFEEEPTLRWVFEHFNTVVLLKVNRVLDRLIDLVQALGLDEHATLVERATLPEARIVRPLSALRGQTVHYLSLVIIHARRDEHDA